MAQHAEKQRVCDSAAERRHGVARRLAERSDEQGPLLDDVPCAREARALGHLPGPRDARDIVFVLR